MFESVRIGNGFCRDTTTPSDGQDGADMTGRGPLEYLVVQFAGDELPAGAARTLEEIHSRDDVRILEAMLILRGPAGAVRCEDFTDVAVHDDRVPALDEDVRLIDAESVVEFAG